MDWLNLQVIGLDMFIIVTAFFSGVWFWSGLKQWKFTLIAIACFAVTGAMAITALGDIGLFLGYQREDFFFMSREFRALPNRYALALIFGIMAFVTRFGRWNSDKK